MDRFDKGRMEAFSDGVLAIAITLLVLELSIPPEGYEHLGRAILEEWPSYIAYVTSFLTIGLVWIVHHGIFRRMRYADSTVTRLNLLVLMVTSFLPFPTKLLAEGIKDVQAERAAVLFYGGVLFVLTSLVVAMCGHIATRTELLHDRVTPEEIRAIGARLAPSLGFYALIIGGAIVAPRIAAFGFLAIAIAGLMRIRGDMS